MGYPEDRKAELEAEIKFLKNEVSHFKNRIKAREMELQELGSGVPLDNLEIDVRTRNSLWRSDIKTVEDLMSFFKEPGKVQLLLRIQRFGLLSLQATVKALIAHGDLPVEYELPEGIGER